MSPIIRIFVESRTRNSMTRINANIEPVDLIDQHLLAEYREMVRIPNAVRKICEAGKISEYIAKCPKTFTLGRGHVRYFTDKQKFLRDRFNNIKAVLEQRHYANNISDAPFDGLPQLVCKDISSDELLAGNSSVVERIIERIGTMKRKPTIDGADVDVDAYAKYLRDKYNT